MFQPHLIAPTATTGSPTEPRSSADCLTPLGSTPGTEPILARRRAAAPWKNGERWLVRDRRDLDETAVTKRGVEKDQSNACNLVRIRSSGHPAAEDSRNARLGHLDHHLKDGQVIRAGTRNRFRRPGQDPRVTTCHYSPLIAKCGDMTRSGYTVLRRK